MKIHFIAIGGSIMHSLAIELKKNGHIVTGSDDIIYEPSKSNLKLHNLLPKKEGWNVSNISKDLDVVILGMHAKKTNPELLKARKYNLKILSFPEFIYNESKNKKRVVIAGSHGKTTITAMVIHVLSIYGIGFDYLIGAKTNSIDNQVKLDNNSIMLIEGDEYLSSAIDLTPKFMHYDPDVLLVSGVAWDHINVFPTKSSYELAFIKILNHVIKKHGTIFYCNEDNFLSNYFTNNNFLSKAYQAPEYIIRDGKFILIYKNLHIPLSVFGKHNMENIQAAQYVCEELGVSELDFYKAIKSFRGASRRLNLIKEINNHSSVYYDFAHSPSKVLATINAVKELHPNRLLIGCLELHTYSSLNINFLPNYCNVFANCDESWLYFDKKELQRKGFTDLDESFLLDSFNNVNLIIINDKEILRKKILNLKLFNSNLLMMTSGNFSGIDIASII